MSFIVPVFNTARYLPTCLDSLLAQDMGSEESEIIVIDDGSTDDSRAVAERYAAENPQLLVRAQSNQGLSVARNEGLRRARGAFVSFVDSDDHVAPHTVRDLADIASRERLDALAFDYVRVEPGQEVLDPPGIRGWEAPAMTGIEHIATYGYRSPVWTYLWDRSFLDRIGLRFEAGRVLEDLIFTATALSAADRVGYVPAVIYRYLKRPGSIMEMRGRQHSLRVTEDWEHAIAGVASLRRAWARRRSTPPAFLDALAATEQRMLFVLIGRLVRSDYPLRPGLSDLLARFRRLGVYPTDRYPEAGKDPLRVRVLSAIFNRPFLLLPFAVGVRAAMRTTGRLA